MTGECDVIRMRIERYSSGDDSSIGWWICEMEESVNESFQV